MAAWSRKTFASLRELVAYLNGALLGAVNLYPNGADLDGLTIIINDGVADRTVTFTAKGSNWSAAEIVAQIAADPNLADDVATIKTTMANYVGAVAEQYLQIVGDPAHIVRSTGTANTALGFSAVSDTTQVITANTDVIEIAPVSDPNGRWVVTLNA